MLWHELKLVPLNLLLLAAQASFHCILKSKRSSVKNSKVEEDAVVDGGFVYEV